MNLLVSKADPIRFITQAHTNSNVSYLHNPTAQCYNAHTPHANFGVYLSFVDVVHLVHLDVVGFEAKILAIDLVNLIH